MNQRTGSHRSQLRQRLPRPARLAPVLAGTALLAAACGGGSPSSGSSSGSAVPAQERAYVRCMNSHGVPGNPDSHGNFETGVNGKNPKFRTANEACMHLFPHTPGEGAGHGNGAGPNGSPGPTGSSNPPSGAKGG